MKKSAGLLMYRYEKGIPQVLLGHMGGPFWAKKDEGAWSIPKGEYGDDEEPLEAAKREFFEETGFGPKGNFLELTIAKHPKGKHIRVWAFEGNVDPSKLISNTFELEWPPRSGKIAAFPEIDKGEWFPTPLARRKIVKSQIAFIDALDEVLEYGSSAERRTD